MVIILLMVANFCFWSYAGIFRLPYLPAGEYTLQLLWLALLRRPKKKELLRTIAAVTGNQGRLRLTVRPYHLMRP